METKKMSLLAILLVASLVPVCKAVPLEWVRQSESPVLDTGGPSPYESYHVLNPSVLIQDGIYKMWYSGYRASPSPRLGICYATSTDKGLTWTKHGTVLEVTEEWERGDLPPESWQVAYPSVIYDKDMEMYQMWYYSTGGSLGYATSTDGINWGNKTQQLGLGYYGDPEVVKGPSDYKLYYNKPGIDIYVMESNDGGVSDPWEVANQDNPVLELGNAGEWDNRRVYTSNVRYEPGTGKFQMWYAGDSTTSAPCIGFALSDDGLTWEKDITNPVLEPVPGTWERDEVSPGSVVFDSSDSMYRMFYGGYHHDHWAIGLAIAVPEPVEVEMEWVTISEAGFAGQMSKYETTNAQYCQFLNAALDNGLISVLDDNVVYATSDTSYSKPFFNTNNGDSHSQITYNGDNFTVNPPRNGYDMNEHPVVEVSFYGAEAFCDYYGYRLPTEDEWEAVADYDGSFIYGCGTTIDHSKANYDDYNPLGLSSHPYTSQVGYYEAYGYALYDMSGNAKEWTTSYWGEGFEDRQILRGGSWGHAVTGCTVSSRDWQYKSDRHYNTGFRVVHTAEPPEPNISVSPLSHDFGDVELGTSRTVIVTISNTGTGDLTVSGIALETDFAITSAPAAAIVVKPNNTVDVEITYMPSALGHNSAILKINSDDPDQPVVEVTLAAVGIEIPSPPSEQIANILAFFDASVEEGTLLGDGPGNSAEKRLNALRNMIEAAGDLIERELPEEACQQLLDACRRMDGQPAPPDFVKGEALPELMGMIQKLMTTLGCE